MKRLILIAGIFSVSNLLWAQNRQEAEQYVKVGIESHDKGDYAGALQHYDKALELDKDNLLALAEKGMTLMAMERFEEAVEFSKRAIETHPGEKDLKNVYVMYGNALDILKKGEQSVVIYDEGL